ncbi:PAS domain-containing protein [Paracoccus sp. NGMCC 1.201697]|uniref:histidine kinase n=1 Tax=Paracoccus broussonetiae subsp. drimophilus TaxID=3373869 RepID=A0ABW7LU45_9RHOB
MKHLLRHRPPLWHLGIFIAAYVMASGFAHLLAIVPGTGISIWPSSGLFMAVLIFAPRAGWSWWWLGGLLAELLGNALWFHNPLAIAALIYAGNALEATVGAWLVIRFCGRPVHLETLKEVLALVLLGAGLAPVISATVGSATLAWFGLQSFATAWPLWWIGDATGVLIVAPLALVVFHNWRGNARFSAARWAEAGVLALIFFSIAALSLSGYLPFAYIIMPPLLWAAVRFEFKGAAVTLAVLALITGVFTLSGTSEFAGDPESQRHRQIMLQLFLVISAFSALIVAALSRQHQFAELTLRRSEHSLRELIETVPALLWRLAPDGEPTFFNKRMAEFLGFDIAEIRGKDARSPSAIEQAVHPEDAAELSETLRTCLVSGVSFAMRYRLRRADGHYRWMSSRAEPLRDEDGQIVQWYGLCHDIDDQVSAEEALGRREREFSQIVNMVPVHIRRLTAAGEPAFFNQRLLDFFGLGTVSELDKPGMSRLAAAIGTLTHPEDAATLLETVRHSVACGEPYSMKYRMLRADGTWRWVDGRAEPLRDQAGNIEHWYAISIDIDDETRALEALRERERELSQLVDMVPSLLWRLSPTGEPVFFSRRMVEFLGVDIGDYDTAEINGLAAAIAAIVHPEDAARLSDALNHALATGESFSMNYRLRRVDGAYRWMSGRGEPLRDEEGHIVQWYGLCHDIDDQLRVEEALRERERALWQLVETLPAMIDCAAPDGEPIYRSQQLREFLGYELEELDRAGTPRLAGTLDAGVHPDDVAGVKDNFGRSLTNGEPYALRHRLRRFDGEYRWVETRAAPMRDAGGNVVQWNVIYLDIDAEVRAQEKLRSAQDSLARSTQAASLAELSASIAHEVNQPLTAVVTYSGALQRWLSCDPPNLERAQNTVDRIIRSADAAADVVGRIRALFRQSMETRDCTPLSGIIAEARDLMAEEAVRRRVRVALNVDEQLPVVALDRVQIQQVLVNLMRNGMDAMNAVRDERVLEIRARELFGMVQVEVNDQGSGVEFPDRVFEPFYTTKEQGMGMGLAICRSIVESHGGRLWVEEGRPRGSTFIFTLPVRAKTAA